MVNCPISGRRVQDIPIRIDKKTDKEFDPRAAIAVSRINYIHSHYKISNNDYLYTLSVFITEPIAWARKYGWRPMSPLERQAFFVFWKGIGELMNIRDTPETLDDLYVWVKEYEANHQTPAESNQVVANYTIEGLLICAPEIFGIRNFLRRLVICVLEVPVADAMLQPRQPWYLHALVETILKSIGFFMLHLSPPRPSSNPQSIVPLAIPENGYMWPNHFAPKPWYKPARTGLGRLMDYLSVAMGLYEDIPGPEYKCEGYRLESMGPISYENSGHNKIMKDAENVLGCPITGVFALKHPSSSRNLNS